MGNVTADETTALLRSGQDASEDDIEARLSYTSSLRRLSSANLPPYHEEPAALNDEPPSALTVWTIVPVSLLGVFVANIDSSLIIASSQEIASEFNALSSASWLITSFTLALCASQPLYGKLSDIFGRRSNLTTSYVFFASGVFLCGIGQKYWHVVVGRAISGIGAAGMTALVSVIIADVVPVRQVASWRSYVNIVATTGRALGGPLGGILCDTIGWRWCFYAQVPPTILGLILILWKLPSAKPANDNDTGEDSFKRKVARVDMVGAFVLVLTIISFLLAMEFANNDQQIEYAIAMSVACVICAILFCLIEKRWAKEPILTLELFTNPVTLTAYLLAGLQMSAQFAMYYSVPIYFQIVSGSNVGQAGLQLVPAVIGNATAGLIAGYIISKSGQYKLLTILGNLCGWLGYFLVFIRWRGNIHPAETLYMFLGGFASGTNQSTTFIHLAANLDQSEIAVAGTALYMIHNLFLLIGIQFSTALLHLRLRIDLDTGLKGVKHKSKIIQSALSSVKSIQNLSPWIRDIVIRAYLDGLTCTFGMSVAFASLGLLVAFCLREGKL